MTLAECRKSKSREDLQRLGGRGRGTEQESSFCGPIGTSRTSDLITKDGRASVCSGTGVGVRIPTLSSRLADRNTADQFSQTRNNLI